METRASQTQIASNENKLRGIAIPFNKPTEIRSNGKLFTEIIRPSAVSKLLGGKSDVRALVNHNPAQVLGRTKSGTLRLWAEADGLAYEVDLPDTQYARDLRTAVERGDVDGCSFGFTMNPQGERWGGNNTVRELVDISVHEISIVTFPAYREGTSVVARSEAIAFPSHEHLKLKIELAKKL